MIEWGFAKQSVRVKDDDTLEVGGLRVLKGFVNDGVLVLDWLDGWKQWAELKASSEFKTLVEKAEENLRKAPPAKGKGKDGKGKNFQ